MTGRFLKIVLVLAIPLLAPAIAGAQDEDPFERVNRVVFGFNRFADQNVLKPVSNAYGAVVPARLRNGIRNVLNNIKEPVVFVNDLLQGERERAGISLGRFMTNTIFGFGLFDVAGEAGWAAHEEDFGQTLAVWGVGSGPYLVLPLFGPSNIRDAGGLAVDSFIFDPFGTYNPIGLTMPLAARIGRSATDAVDLRYRYGPQLDDLYTNSLDPYSTFKTVFQQRRAAEIANGQPGGVGNQNYEQIFQDPTPP